MPAQRQPGGPPTLPLWLPAALFAAATAVLFAEFIFSDLMLYGEDTLSLGYMARAFFQERITSGDLPLWQPRVLGGVPMFESISAGDGIYPTSLLYFVSEGYRALGWKLVLHVLGGGFFFYGWARCLGLGRAAATIGGLAWLMAPVTVTLALPGNDGKLMVASLAPLVFWGAESAVRAPSGRAAAGLAGAVALVALTTQFQTAYFLYMSAGAYAVFRAVCIWRLGRGGGRRRAALLGLGVFAGGAVLGAAIAAVQLVPAAQYVTEFSRRVATTTEATPEERIAYSSSWSLHPEEAAALVVPEFVGNTAADADWGRGTYWGRNALKLNHEYLGVTVAVLALFGLLGRRRRALRRFMAGLSAVWLLFALGAHTPVWRIFYEIVPGISIFRVPAIAAFLISFGVTTLMAFGADDLARGAFARDGFMRTPRGRVLAGLAGVLLLGLLLQAGGALDGIWTATLYGDIDARSRAALAAADPHITRGFGIALLLALLSIGAIWAATEGRMPMTGALAALAVLVAVDLGRIDRAFIRTMDFHAWAAPDANARFLQRRLGAEPPFRVADLRGSDQNVDLAMHGLDLFAGHHPNDLARYRRLLGLQGSRASGDNTRHPNVLRMMNVKYIAWPQDAAGGPPYEGAQALSSARGGGGAEAVYAYPGLDRAWLAQDVSALDDDAALARILSRGFDPAREAILAEGPDGAGADSALPASLPGTGTVSWELADPDHRRLRVSATGPALLVVSENWFPGWTAEVNGEPTPVRRVNLTLQAVEIPGAGDHAVELRFTAPTVRRALGASIPAALIAIVLAAAPLLRRLSSRAIAWRRPG